jgi:hypothetical protein
MEEIRSAAKKLESQEVARRFNETSKFRAVVYARLMRAMVDAFGEEVLDIAEEIRRENGRYLGERNVDILAQERLYDQDPAQLIDVQEEIWQGLSAAWSRTCPCIYIPAPEKRWHELHSLWCVYAEAFRSVREEKIGITWCCWDMGATPAAHPLFCQYMPAHMLKGDNHCFQIRRLADTPEQQAWLNSIEHTGWRSWK